MQYRIDYIKDEELEYTLNLVKKVFDEFNSSDYNEQGIESFYEFIDEENIKKEIDSGNLLILVARTTDDVILGTIAVSSSSHISLLFVDKKFHKKGIGKNLLKFAINICKYNDEEVEKVTVNSTPYSVEFFKKSGFDELAKMQESDGIVYMPMALMLGRDSDFGEKEEEERFFRR